MDPSSLFLGIFDPFSLFYFVITSNCQLSTFPTLGYSGLRPHFSFDLTQYLVDFHKSVDFETSHFPRWRQEKDPASEQNLTKLVFFLRPHIKYNVKYQGFGSCNRIEVGYIEFHWLLLVAMATKQQINQI